MVLGWLERNKHVVFYQGSPVELLEFDPQGPALGVMLGDTRMGAKYMLRNVPLQLGDGIYNVNFLVMPHSIFDMALPAVPPNNTCVRLFVENYSNLTAEARRDTIVRFHDLMAAEPVVTVRARCCDLTMLTVSNTRSECTARARG
jgi:hypothetical protein